VIKIDDAVQRQGQGQTKIEAPTTTGPKSKYQIALEKDIAEANQSPSE
jgi:hypothetical protein